MRRDKTSQSGVALLMSLGILAILSILGVAFSTNMRLMERTTRDFVYEMQARYLAQGGIEYAIAKLKEDARDRFVYDGIGEDGKLNIENIEFPQDIIGKVGIKVIDTARQININNANEKLLACLPGIKTKAGNITSKRKEMPDKKYLTKQSVAIANGIGKGIFNDIKDYITTDTYIDPNVQDNLGNSRQRSAININTVLNNDDGYLLAKILDAASNVTASSASTAATALMNKNNGPVDSWGRFNTIIKGLSIEQSAKDSIMTIFNPNRGKSDNDVPTEFCFHSGGTYELDVTADINKGAQTIATKRITAIVKLFNLWNMTRKAGFIGEDVNYDGIAGGGEDTNGDGRVDIPEYARITWLDSCPVNIDECYRNSYGDGKIVTISDSLKIGYWDDFTDETYSSAQWRDNPWIFQDPVQGPEVYTDSYTISGGLLKTEDDENKKEYTNRYGNVEDPDRNLFYPDAYPKIDLGSINVSDLLYKRWRWFSFNLKCRVIDEFDRPIEERRGGIPWHSIPAYWENLPVPQMRLQTWQNVGQILFWRAGRGSEASEDSERNNSVYVTYPDRPIIPPIGRDRGGNPASGDRIVYYDYGPDDNLKIWKNEHDDSDMPLRHDGEDPYRGGCSGGHGRSSLILATVYNYRFGDLPRDRRTATYQATKDVHLTARTYVSNRENVRIKAKVSSWSYDARLANPYNKRGPGLISLYGEGNLPCMDHIRIIPTDGHYISYPIDFGTQPFEWGTIFWTQTTPDTVEQNRNEKVYITFETASSNSYSFSPSWISNEDDLYRRVTRGDLGWDAVNGYTWPGTGRPIGLTYAKTTKGHRYLRFKALLETSDNSDRDFLDNYSETPVLEDVWITYLPKTKILYWREGIEEVD